MEEVFILSDTLGDRLRTTVSQVRKGSFTKKEMLLFVSLMVFAFVPSVNQLIVDNMVIEAGTDVLNIAAQIEWFDLFNETVSAFLIVPMYFVLNGSKDDDDMSRRINLTFLISSITYSMISMAIYLYASNLAAYMNSPDGTFDYLRMETIGFILGFVSSYLYVVFVVRGRYLCFIGLLIAEMSTLSVGNMIFIPGMGAMGIAVTNILVNFTMSIVSVILLYREGLIRRGLVMDRGVFRDWMRVGTFSGGQVLLANLVYMMIVMRMINDVSQIGNYWLANNFIWGWLLIPMMAVGEMVKREYFNGYRRIWNYLLLTIVILVVWFMSVPLWESMFTKVLGLEDPAPVLWVLYRLAPFYVFYAFSIVLQGVLISVGRTDYLLAESAIVNLVYYGCIYALFKMGVFAATMDFAIMLFGFGMVVCFLLDVVFYILSK